MKNVFVAVATGQKIANLPLLLQYEDIGDRVLWLLFPEANDRAWQQLKSVLRRRCHSSDTLFPKTREIIDEEALEIVRNSARVNFCEHEVACVYISDY